MILGSIVSKSMKYYHRRIVTTRKLNCLLSDRPTSFSLFGIHWDQNRRSQSMLTAQPRMGEVSLYGWHTVRLVCIQPNKSSRVTSPYISVHHRGNYHCIAGLLFAWFVSNQTSQAGTNST